MASSTRNQPHLIAPYGTTAAPPPTPSTQSQPLCSSDSADFLSRLLHRLPPTLSLPNRRSPPTSAATTNPPLISLSSETPTLTADLLSAASRYGFFQLTDHSISPQLAQLAESESLSLFNLSRDQKQLFFPKNWPLGFDCDEDDDDNGINESFCLDSDCSTESTELSMDSLRGLTHQMEKIGMKIIRALSCALGFENPVREDPTRVCSLMWISEGVTGKKPDSSGRFYPYIVGLEYQIKCQKISLLADSGWVSVSPQIDSILVTLGDIAQVWSNGKMKKVRGRPVVPICGDGENGTNNNENGHCITMSMLLTLPVESTVSPLLLPKLNTGEEDDQADINDIRDEDDRVLVFNSFSFEDYAWRVYHERLHLKDPLHRYRRI